MRLSSSTLPSLGRSGGGVAVPAGNLSADLVPTPPSAKLSFRQSRMLSERGLPGGSPPKATGWGASHFSKVGLDKGSSTYSMFGVLEPPGSEGA